MRKKSARQGLDRGRAAAAQAVALPSNAEVMTRTMSAILEQTSSLLAGECGARIDGFDLQDPGLDRVRLHDITAVAGFGHPVGLMIAFSFDQGLLGGLLERATASNPVPQAERELYLRETAAEVVNTVLGLCTADLVKRHQTVSLSPPVVLEGERDIHREGDALLAGMEILTDKGALSVNLFGPRHLFDERLNYRH